MKKGKAITLLTIVCFIMAFFLVMSFLRFSYGIKYNYNSVLGAINLDYDLAGGMTYTLTLDSEYAGEEVDDIEKVLTTINSRMKMLGYKTYSVNALREIEEGVEDYSIRISARSIYYTEEGKPDSNQLYNDVKAAAAYGYVQFFGGTSSDPSTAILDKEEPIRDAVYMGDLSGDGSSFTIAIKLTDYGYDELLNNINSASGSSYYLKITLNEESDPLFNTTITADAISSSDKTIYASMGSESGAKQAAMQIKTGGLDYKYNISTGTEITPVFGDNTATLVAIAIGAFFVVAIALLIVLFRGYGIISMLSLVGFGLIEMGMLVAVPGIILNISGVIGIVLATVVAIDGLIITVKRIQEEYANGKTVKASVKTGFKRAFLPVLNSCVVVEIFALLLFAFTGGTLQCFAITLAIGTVVAFISSVLFSRMFVELILPLTKNTERFLNLKREDK